MHKHDTKSKRIGIKRCRILYLVAYFVDLVLAVCKEVLMNLTVGNNNFSLVSNFSCFTKLYILTITKHGNRVAVL